MALDSEISNQFHCSNPILIDIIELFKEKYPFLPYNEIFDLINIEVLDNYINFINSDLLPKYYRRRELLKLKKRSYRSKKSTQKDIGDRLDNYEKLRFFHTIKNQKINKDISSNSIISNLFKLDIHISDTHYNPKKVLNEFTKNNHDNFLKKIKNIDFSFEEKKQKILNDFSEKKNISSDNIQYDDFKQDNKTMSKILKDKITLEREDKETTDKFKIQKSKKKVNIEKILELIPDTPDIIQHTEPEKPSTLEDYYKLFEE